jgi:fatty-acid desaturase
VSSAVAQRGHYSKLAWSTAFFMMLFHVGAVWALLQFTWSGLAVFLITYYISLSLGIGMAYHRLLTHRSYKTPRTIEYFLTICATLALEGGPLFWVATHRKHHQHSDTDHDPHTPRHGGLWAHMGWILFGDALHNDNTMTTRYAPDLGRDRFHLWISKYHWIPLTTLGFVLLALGGWNWVLWGVFLRTTVGLHATWLVNSATHMWGSRRFNTRDDSRNSWLVKAGTTITTRIQPRPRMVSPGMRSTSPTGISALWKCWDSLQASGRHLWTPRSNRPRSFSQLVADDR